MNTLYKISKWWMEQFFMNGWDSYLVSRRIGFFHVLTWVPIWLTGVPIITLVQILWNYVELIFCYSMIFCLLFLILYGHDVIFSSYLNVLFWCSMYVLDAFCLMINHCLIFVCMHYYIWWCESNTSMDCLKLWTIGYWTLEIDLG